MKPASIQDHQKKSRGYRAALVSLVDAIALAIQAIDEEMKGPSTRERGSNIASICNALELSKDLVCRFVLNVRLSSKKKR
jgi:hypothetical protein